jgi:hypothetical protein
MGGRSSVIWDNPLLARQALYGAVDYGAKFGGVLFLSPYCQSAAGFVGAEPGGVAVLFFGSFGVTDLQEERLHDIFLDTVALPGIGFWLEVEVKMLRLDCANGTGFFQGLALGSLAVR